MGSDYSSPTDDNRQNHLQHSEHERADHPAPLPGDGVRHHHSCPARYQQGRGINPKRREPVGERPANWIPQTPSTTCERCGMAIKGNQRAFRQHQQLKRCLRAQQLTKNKTTWNCLYKQHEKARI